MKLIFLMFCCLLPVAYGDEPPLVRAIVCDLTHDPDSGSLQNRYVPGMQPPVWLVKLEVIEVLRGDPRLKGQTVATASADSLPDGNGRFVTPRLNEGDVGIWALKQLTDGSWAEIYTPYKVEKEIQLPLIKGRHDAYEKVLSRLSGGQAPEPSSDVIAQKPSLKPEPSANRPPSVQTTAPKQAPEAKPSPTKLSEDSPSSIPWSLIVVLIVAACGLLWLVLKRCS